jgi:trans-2,3-dihydro-3-hydroxyanthranilate isomerase
MRREFRFTIVDVFTDRAFGGNPLAVIPDARSITDAEMQRIAAEFNFSETTFVLPPADPANSARVRIFTPRREIPFAGHPNIGTAFVLAGPGGAGSTLRFEEAAGIVAVAARHDEGGIVCRLEAPQLLEVRETLSAGDAAALAGLNAPDIVTCRHAPLIASVGIPFLFAEVADPDALARAVHRPNEFPRRLPAERSTGIHLYTRLPAGEPLHLRARMFAPLFGVPEDPATGSANCALAALLASLEDSDGDHAWRIGQGFEMGRPGVLRAGAARRDGVTGRAWLEGASVKVAEGTFYLS